MQPVSYTFSSLLSENLSAIDMLRTKILSVALSPSAEHALRWASMVESILGSLSLSRQLITRQEIEQALTHPKPSMAKTGVSVIAYANALRWIAQHWTGNPRAVQAGDVAVLTAIALSQPHRSQFAFASQEKNIAAFCRYINSQHDHPVITAGLIHGYLCRSAIGILDQGRIARLSSSMILAQWGYDIRGIAHPETVWAEDPKAYDFALLQSETLGQLTPWLEYVAESIKASFIKLHQEVERRARGIHTSDDTIADLSRRQQAIVDLAAAPEVRLTNRIVQSRYHISAITASRDLARLHALGILYAHGKGRSVYYTRI